MPENKSKANAQNWQRMLSDWVQEAERIAQTVQRKGKLSVERLVQTLVLGCLNQPEASLNDLAQTAYQLGVDIRPSSLDERITPRTGLLLASVFQLGLQRQVASPKLPSARLSAFSAVYVVDSTQITVSPSLYETFQGNGKNAKMKVQVAIDYLRGSLALIDCQAGRSPDQRCALLPTLMQPQALLLFDLGYFKQETLRDMDAASAAFVTRCQSQVALYDPDSAARVSMSQVLAQHKGDTFEGSYRLGARTHLLVRLVARRVSEPHAAQRRREAKSKAQRQGQTCSQDYLNGLDWEILITNLEPAWSLDDLFALYGIRWQIELIFKAWKSRLGLARLGAWRPARVMGQFYAHLIGALLCHTTFALHRFFDHSASSFAKCVGVIQQRVTDLMTLIRRNWRGLYRWANDLRLALQRFAQHDKRKATPTTIQFLMDWGLT